MLMHKLGLMVRVGRLAGTAVLLAACMLPTAFAYDSAKLEAALDSLSAASFLPWKKRARAGDPVAQNVIGMAYKYGEVTAQNRSLSLRWFLKAAHQGDSDAQFNLGRIYGKATGSVYGKQRAVPRDDVAAAHWYQSAAEQDYGPAQRNLADMYAEGSPTVPRDRARAVFWLKRAAAAGDLAASGLVDKLDSELTTFERQVHQTMETRCMRPAIPS